MNIPGSVIFANENNFDNDLDADLDLDVEYESQNQNKTKGYPNPYTMYRHNVRPCHFAEARLYDLDISQAGWQISHRKARREYRKWLLSVRRIPGWENFRRTLCEIEEEMTDDDGNIYIIRKLVPVRDRTRQFIHRQNITSNLTNNPNRRTRLLPQSRDKGVKITDENFRPRMFTEKMGREISQIRNNLGLTQADLARKINVDAHTIRDIELGGLITFNSEDVLVKELATTLGMPSIKYLE
jgi:ribosome-binding protein aMBF1 (putative translation factor)